MLLEVLSSCAVCHREKTDTRVFSMIDADLGRSLTHNFSLRILRSIEDLIDLTYSDNVSSSTSSLLLSVLIYSSTESIIILKLLFDFICYGSLSINHWETIFLILSLLTKLRLTPVYGL